MMVNLVQLNLMILKNCPILIIGELLQQGLIQ